MGYRLDELADDLTGVVPHPRRRAAEAWLRSWAYDQGLVTFDELDPADLDDDPISNDEVRRRIRERVRRPIL